MGSRGVCLLFVLAQCICLSRDPPIIFNILSLCGRQPIYQSSPAARLLPQGDAVPSTPRWSSIDIRQLQTYSVDATELKIWDFVQILFEKFGEKLIRFS